MQREGSIPFELSGSHGAGLFEKQGLQGFPFLRISGNELKALMPFHLLRNK
jgi:hypothetical protein